MTWRTIKIVGISVVLLIPALQGMQKINDESLPVQMRHRGYTPLHVAVYLGDREQITRLIADGAVVDARSVSGYTPLHIAAERGDVGIVELLITELEKIRSFASPWAIPAPSMVDIRDNSDVTPLACAAANGHTDVIECLIRHGASIYEADKQGYFPFHRATQNGHLEAMRMLLPDFQFDQAGHLEPMPLAEGSNDDVEFSAFCWTALECAVESGKTEVLVFVMKLMEGHRDPETGVNLEQCGNGVTPFLLAAEYGHIHLLQWLLDADMTRIHARDKEGASALHHAAQYGQTDAARFILERDPEKINDIDNLTYGYRRHKYNGTTVRLAGNTALHEAAYNGHSKVIELLLSHGANRESTDLYGSTALHVAAMNGHKQALELLLSSGASVAATDHLERTPLHLAAEKGHTACVETLLAHKADIEAKAKENLTPLHVAAEAGQLEVIKCLVKNGADISKKSALGTPLMHAIMREHVDVIKYFILNTSAELTAYSKSFQATVPLIFIAAAERKSESVRCLLTNGVSVHTSLNNGRTVLHRYPHCFPNRSSSLSFTYGDRNLAIHSLLMRAGADMLCPDNAGVTPLDTLKLPADQFTAAKQYYQNRPLYLKGRIGKDDTLDAVFSQAAEVRFDIPVLVGLKDQLKDRLVHHRWKGGKNLLMVALAIKDLDGITQILDQRICAITDVDDENHDALWYAINTKKLSIINGLLEAGATVTNDHVAQAASFEPGKEVNEILMRLLTIYRYSQRTVNERVSLFK